MKLLVAVPSHSGSIMAESVQSLIAIHKMVLERGGSFEWRWESGAMISVVRNLLVAQFLESDAELMLMLDADQAVWPDMLERMIAFDKPVVGCIYPKRRYDWAKARHAPSADIDQLLYRASEFVGWLEEDAQGQATLVDGFARAEHVGTGILLIRREAFHTLMERSPELKGRGFAGTDYPQYEATGRWGFFNTMDDPEGPQVSEDLSFCRRWRAAGGEIWAEITGTTMHIGPHRFLGNYFDYLKAKAPL